MDPQQEMFSALLIALREKYKGTRIGIYDTVLPLKDTPYPFVYLADCTESDQATLAEYEIMMEALELRMLDESLHEHRQAFLNFAVKAEKKAGKGKTKPVYKRFRQFFDLDKELRKIKNRRKPSRFAGITKLSDREE